MKRTPPPPKPPTPPQTPYSPPIDDDYSAASTLTYFPQPLPLLRGATKDDNSTLDPSLSPYLLAFDTPLKWVRAQKYCKAQLMAQCLSGARIGCSLTASERCKTPWWKSLLGMTSKDDFKERQKCEEIEMKECFDLGEARCGEFVEKRCEDVFGKARVCVVVGGDGMFRLISKVCFGHKRSFGIGVLELSGNYVEILKVVRGSDLVVSDDVGVDDWLKEELGR